MKHTKIEFGFGAEIDRDGVRLTGDEQSYALAAVQRAAVGLWSAYTLTPTRGGWTNPRGVLVEEQGATLSVIVEHADADKIAVMVAKIKEYFRQEAVALTLTPVNFSIL